MPPALFSTPIPSSSGEPHTLAPSPGDVYFVIGANGSGKSSLLHWLVRQNRNVVHRISANRQLWFQTGQLGITSAQHTHASQQISKLDTRDEARWVEHEAAQRVQLALYELIRDQLRLDQQIADAARVGDTVRVDTLRHQLSPIERINRLFFSSNLHLHLRVEANESVRASRGSGAEYDIAQLSDGERNALLIATNVLTAPKNKVLIIDEPERHLHRSIISPFLVSLISERRDLAFIISTHELHLPLDIPEAQSLLTRACSFDGQTPKQWSLDILPGGQDLPDWLRADILGSRSRILFVEGTPTSRDLPLYTILFPDVSIIPKGSCRDVARAVEGIRDNPALHWLAAYGLVDRDGRDDDARADSHRRGIYMLPYYAVESVYYHPTIIQAVASRLGSVIGEDTEERGLAAVRAAVASIAGEEKRLAREATVRAVKDQLAHIAPKLDENTPEPISISLPWQGRAEETERALRTAIEREDLETITRIINIKKTQLRRRVVDALGLRDEIDYEMAVRQTVLENSELLERVRTWFGAVRAALYGQMS